MLTTPSMSAPTEPAAGLSKSEWNRLWDRSRLARINPLVALLLLAICSSVSTAQTSADQDRGSLPSPKSEHAPDNSLPPVDLKSLPRNLFVDQKKFWTAPFYMTQLEWQWTVPVALVGAVFLASDTAFEKHLPTSPSTVSHAVTASNAGVAALAGAGAGMFLLGNLNHSDPERETGLLSGEAGIDAALDAIAFKYALGRDRPFTGNGRGRFFQGGNSFPSEHATVSWAIASVIAHEYPGPLTQILAYGVAGGVSAARVVGHQHFVSDVVGGSALGWYIGRQVFREHSHYSDADIARIGTFRKSAYIDTGREADNMGSPFVPLDSWIYPAMERLIAQGYIHSADLGMRPWTRMECARLLHEEAAKSLEDSDENGDSEKILAALEAEFKYETDRLDGGTNLGVGLDSVYTRFTGISGTPLHDGLHFGQTIVNDFGRPYGEGLNNITGFSGHGVAGPLSFYLRAEYQHAPSAPGISASAAQNIQSVDFLPATDVPPTVQSGPVSRGDLLEGYVGMQLNNWQITFGKQALWWGPDASGPMLFSTNAEPILMLQVNRVRPFRLPSLLGAIGDLRISYLVGRISGYHWVDGPTGFIGSWSQTLKDQPFIVGEKVTLKPTPDLELGISITALFGGPGVPATLHKLLQAGFSSGNGNPGTAGDPGDRRGGFDFNYRIPGARDWLSFYADAFTEDEPNPWFAWNKTALTSGLYFARVPGIPKLDLRVEGLYTDPPGGGTTVERGFFYINDRFVSGYTNKGNLIGSWIGREGQGADAWANYWISPKTKLQVNFRHQKVSHQFITNGGTLTDLGVAGGYQVRPSLGLSAWVQHEAWVFPVIQPNPARNVTAGFEILFEPRKFLQRSNQSAPRP